MGEKRDGSEITDLVSSTPDDKDGKIDEIKAGITDIAEERRFQSQTQQAQKMEAISTLAGGIAHQFNNALVGIIGNIELLKKDLPDGKKVDKYIEPMEVCVHRMTRLTNQLLAYACGGKYETRTISLSAFIEDTLPVIKSTIAPAIRIETDFASDIPNIEVDLTQMQMVISSVLVNAAEATEGSGFIRIKTREEHINEELAKRKPGLKAGHFVCLMVEDDGKGMDENTKIKVFEPFFSTKFQGRGLGMAAVYGVVKNHDGWVSIDSDLGKGTKVSIYFPAIDPWIGEGEDQRVELVKVIGRRIAI